MPQRTTTERIIQWSVCLSASCVTLSLSGDECVSKLRSLKPSMSGARSGSLSRNDAQPRNLASRTTSMPANLRGMPCEAITGDGVTIFQHACRLGLEGIVSNDRLALCERSDQGMVEDEEPGFSAQLTGDISNAEIDRLIANFRTHPLAESELQKSKKVSLSL